MLLSASKKAYIAVKLNYEAPLEAVRNSLEIIKSVNINSEEE